VYITVVSVVRDTGKVKLPHIVAVNDVGTVTNP
jgi:CO/xanthine dehydrogenase Mo-binding subunit